MASIVLINPTISVNSVDLSNHVQKVTIEVKVDEQDSTAFGSSWHERVGGLMDWSIKLDFKQDFDAASVDATLWPLLGQTVPVAVKPTSAAVSATNPQYSGNVVVSQYLPVDGGVGDLLKMSVSWNGSGPLTRATS